ncbi:hypothetical protein [Sulfolobus islandicus rudivirus 1 variant XX]|uniref:Uncharacterized protein n=1 Tax=Sulfolobus islandicus rod-shaped virus 1 TaxID=157898 RepID=Q5TJ98_SIRV1|nr:hypothetical protein [Sulfolobus islandicus rudivirus 1 variant XX]
MVIEVFYMCPIDYKDILTLDLDKGGIAIRECDHVFGYIIPPSFPEREDKICPKQYRIRTWTANEWKYGVCVQSNVSSKHVVRNIKKLKKTLKELLNYREDQIIYFILDGSTRREIIDKIKDMIKDMFVGYKADSEFCTPKIITIVGVLNKVTIYFL